MSTAVVAPEVSSLRLLVAQIERCREGRTGDSKQPDNQPKCWGKKEHGRAFLRNPDGSACYFTRYGETLRAVVADVLREAGYSRNPAFEPNYEQIGAALIAVKAHNPHIIDFDALEENMPLVIPAQVCRGI